MNWISLCTCRSKAAAGSEDRESVNEIGREEEAERDEAGWVEEVEERGVLLLLLVLELFVCFVLLVVLLDEFFDDEDDDDVEEEEAEEGGLGCWWWRAWIIWVREEERRFHTCNEDKNYKE